MIKACTVTPTRIAWLKHLAEKGTTAWDRMPRKSGGRGPAVSNQTWKPMCDAGLITAEYRPAGRLPGDWYFTITDTGRALLASIGAQP